MYTKGALTKLTLNTIVGFLLCGLAVAQTETFHVVPPERIPEILNTISSHVHANFRRIQTWQGQAEVSWYDIYKGGRAKDIFVRYTDAVGATPNSITEIAQSTTTFSSDLDKGLFYAKNHRTIPTRYVDAASKRDLGTKSIPSYRIAILTPEYYLESTPNRIRDGHIVQRRAVKKKVDKDRPLYRQPSVFDPRDLFDARSPVWLLYPRILKRIKEKGEYVVDDKYALKVERRVLDGDVQYRIHRPAKMRLEGGNVWQIKTFSSDAGYNMISSECTRVNREPIDRRIMEYRSVQGVYVPSKVTRESFDPQDGSVQHRKVQIFKNVRINHAIPAETFTYKNLGLEDGDEFQDRILDKRHIYKHGELVEVPKPK